MAIALYPWPKCSRSTLWLFIFYNLQFDADLGDFIINEQSESEIRLVRKHYGVVVAMLRLNQTVFV